MATNNTIALRHDYIPVLDEVYKATSKTAILDSNTGLERLPSGEFYVPVMTLDGLANHDRSNGGKYVEGSTNLEYKPYRPTYSRNRKFTIDVRDEIESGDVAFSRLSGEFIRTKVVPEIDAVRFASYATNAGKTEEGTLATFTDFLDAVEVALTEQDDLEVTEEGKILFATPSHINQLLRMNTYQSQNILDAFDDIVKVSPSRFFTVVKLLTGTGGEDEGGFEKGAAAKDINFLIVQKAAVIQDAKHVAPKHIPAALNQEADGDSFAYRIDGVEEVFYNKKAGIYAHVKQSE